MKEYGALTRADNQRYAEKKSEFSRRKGPLNFMHAMQIQSQRWVYFN
jgi:hypothetical protein